MSRIADAAAVFRKPRRVGVLKMCMVAPWDSSYQFSKIIAAVELAVLDLAQVGEVDPGFRPVLQRRLLHRVKFSVSVAEGHGAGPACCFSRPDDPGDCDDVHGPPSARIMNARRVVVKRIVGGSAEDRDGSGDADELESSLSGRIAHLPYAHLVRSSMTETGANAK